MEPEKDKLINKVLDMPGNRDKKVAHDRTPKRGIGYCELKDKQALSRHIILSHIEFKLKPIVQYVQIKQKWQRLDLNQRPLYLS